MKTRTFLAVAMALAFVAGTVALPSLADAAQTLHGGGGHGGGYRVSGAYHGSGYHGGVYLGGYGGGGYGGSYYGGLRRRMRTHAGGLGLWVPYGYWNRLLRYPAPKSWTPLVRARFRPELYPVGKVVEDYKFEVEGKANKSWQGQRESAESDRRLERRRAGRRVVDSEAVSKKRLSVWSRCVSKGTPCRWEPFY
jgi:hypothetical protein